MAAFVVDTSGGRSQAVINFIQDKSGEKVETVKYDVGLSYYTRFFKVPDRVSIHLLYAFSGEKVMRTFCLTALLVLHLLEVFIPMLQKSVWRGEFMPKRQEPSRSLSTHRTTILRWQTRSQISGCGRFLAGSQPDRYARRQCRVI